MRAVLRIQVIMRRAAEVVFTPNELSWMIREARLDFHQRSLCEAQAANTPFTALTLLLIEDDHEFSDAVRELLVGAGYAVV